MKYLNLGCGRHYKEGEEWTNVDFEGNEEGVIGHNLLNGIPFPDSTFDFVYHSHVLEHFSKSDGRKFLKECFRVLKPGGVLRVVIPDLEVIAKLYLKLLDDGVADPSDDVIRANYEWMKLEMIDQIARHKEGGHMIDTLFKDRLLNESFIYGRIGEEGRFLRERVLANKKVANSAQQVAKKNVKERIKAYIKRVLMKLLRVDEKYNEIGKFRLGGEVHQWMYDRYSLSNLLSELGGTSIESKTAFTSNIPNFESYELDGKNGSVRKPDSLFMEAIK